MEAATIPDQQSKPDKPKQRARDQRLKAAAAEKKRQAEQPDAPEQVLEINTLAPLRPYGTVDQVRHDFKLTQEFGSREHREFARDSERYDELWARKDDLADDENELMDRLADSLFDTVLLEPERLREQLGPEREEDGRMVGLTGAIKRSFIVTFTDAPQLVEWKKAVARRQAEDAAEQSTTGG